MLAKLKQTYGKMETEDLIRIAFVDHEDYKPEAVSLATTELKKRGISKQEVTLTAKRVFQERKDAEEKVATKPLSAKEKVLFVVFPVIAFYYMIFVPRAWKQRSKQAFKFYMFGLGAWLLFKFLAFYLLPKLGW